MQTVTSLFETFINAALIVPKVLLTILPLYNELNSFNQNLIAAALGVSPLIVGLIYKLVKCLIKGRYVI